MKSMSKQDKWKQCTELETETRKRFGAAEKKDNHSCQETVAG